jgi:hypothetical protein
MKVLLKIKFLLFSWKAPVDVVIYLLNVIDCITNIIQLENYLTKQSLLICSLIRKNSSYFCSEDSSSITEKNEQIKNKLREKLRIIDTGSCINLSDENNRKNYFELIYECIETRSIFLNFIDMKVHNHAVPDLDLAILQALLNGM